MARNVDDMDLASFGRRYVAALIDLAIAFLVAAIIAIALALLGAPWPRSDRGGQTLIVVVLILYFVGLEGASGATLGKRLLGLRVVMDYDDPIGMWEALVRNTLRPVDAFFWGLVGAFFASRSPKRQRLGDRAAGTVVVRRRAGQSSGPRLPVAVPAPADRPPTFAGTRSAIPQCGMCGARLADGDRFCPRCGVATAFTSVAFLKHELGRKRGPDEDDWRKAGILVGVGAISSALTDAFARDLFISSFR